MPTTRLCAQAPRELRKRDLLIYHFNSPGSKVQRCSPTPPGVVPAPQPSSWPSWSPPLRTCTLPSPAAPSGLEDLQQVHALRVTLSKPRPLQFQAPPPALAGSAPACWPPSLLGCPCSRLHPLGRPWSCAASPPANMALRAARTVRAAACSLRAAWASATPCPPRPWGLRAGAIRTLRTGPSLLLGKHEWARGLSGAASGWG